MKARLYFSAIGDKALKKNDIASVRFDMGQEKIVKPESNHHVYIRFGHFFKGTEGRKGSSQL